jgi:hypothetical protein
MATALKLGTADAEAILSRFMKNEVKQQLQGNLSRKDFVLIRGSIVPQ